MAFHVHRSERADRLILALAELLTEPLDDPMVAEVVAVPTRGVERWVSQRLAAHLGTSAGGTDGVCANVDFPFPGRLVGEAVDAGTPEHAGSEVWRPERMVWPLVEVIGAHLGEPWLAPLAGLVGGDEATTDRRFGAVRHVADLFDRYSVHRPAMLRAWAAGDHLGGDGDPLPADARWQAELWCRLRDRLGVPSGAERLVTACERLAADPAIVDLPARLVLFGLTRIPASHVELLRALAVGRDIHLFALHPSPELWARIEAEPAPAGRVLRRDDPTAGRPRHPLLAGWGRDAREMQLVLASGLAGGAVDRHYPVPAAGGTLLERIQADVRADRLPTGRPAPGQPERRPELASDDRSIQVHDCHGRARQVEVLRDAVLHLLRDDPTLEPRDIVVMCPDIDTFAPLIHATFGTGRPEQAEDGEETLGGGPGDLRVRLADRSLRQTNPVLAVVSELLDLAEARLTASQVLDLAGRDPVRTRFGFDDDDIDRLEQWVAAAGIRWGLDGAHREPYGLGGLEANTWKAGLERLLLGAAMSEDGHPLVGGVLPLDDVGSGDLELAGRLAELVTRLGTALDRLVGPQPLAGWVDALGLATWSLTATSDADDWQRRELDQLLDDLTAEAGDQAAGPLLTLAELRALVADRLRGHPTRANFRTGHLTICTLVPMRSVPHRVVCLLGLDDGAFPRPSPADGDDLIERVPFVGDRDGRSEDRQLLLDALLAATDHLIITYSGRDERTNARRPPAVPLGELLDTADSTAVPAGGAGSVRDVIRIVHPLQPFDPRNFTPGGLGPARTGSTPWSFDPLYLAGAEAMQAPRGRHRPFLDGSLTPLPPRAIELEALTRFLRHPVREFLRQRLGVVLTDRSTDPDDALSVELDALQRWKVGDRLLQARLGGADPVSIRAAEIARGELPPGELGEAALSKVAPVVDHLVEVAATHPVPASAEVPRSIDVAVELGQGFSVVGTVTGIIGSTARSVAYSRVRPDLRLAAWARLLVLVATDPEVPWTAVTIGQSGGKVVVATAGPLPGDPEDRRRLALVHLGLLVDLYQRGMTAPLPIYTATSAAYAEATIGRKDPVAAARANWATTKDDWDNEDRDAHHQLVLGRIAELEEFLDEKPLPDEEGPGWADGEAHRLGRYALRLWTGLLQHERMATP